MTRLNILAVTACISGVAYTYMAAEYIEKLALQENWRVKVETQGALGIENPIDESDILKGDLILIISNKQIDHKARFQQKRCLEIDINQFLLQDKVVLLKQIKKVLSQPAGF
ncbi:fructose PTS transporter subunit IIB [Utexia brackfieldae]|uniref:fructose PTS transporter subunit IIB n=1 Tax=Utexia brackfieldae TaxID=3074108 RepID=UPI00370D9484